MPDGLEREPKGCQAGSVAQDREAGLVAQKRGGRLCGLGKGRSNGANKSLELTYLEA